MISASAEANTASPSAGERRHSAGASISVKRGARWANRHYQQHANGNQVIVSLQVGGSVPDVEVSVEE
jgi:hypothetical protein